ncbi:uncharacterized protein LDX57_008362 [Aspergillus melleus]|uniref:uncharacterized protein n=1 Tax=Aspergillus melleus TaxID=138277 RepID=UPI001E8D1B6A|nr:uncharacterized protein LDX57_008362 [Aspergillus melleus]KAH8430700.1 hypothetical protein LDX57_008362 [Aspergillus melleus]
MAARRRADHAQSQAKDVPVQVQQPHRQLPGGERGLSEDVRPLGQNEPVRGGLQHPQPDQSKDIDTGGVRQALPSLTFLSLFCYVFSKHLARSV